jgi:adenylate cyclase
MGGLEAHAVLAVRLPAMRPLRRLLAAVLIAAGLSLGVVLLHVPGTPSNPLRQLDATLYDTVYQLRPIEDMQNSDVVIVAVDDQALKDIDQARGYAAGWPWPRQYWGSVLEYLAEDCQAKAVVFDVLFSERSNSAGKEGKSDDELFAAQINRAMKEGRAAIVFASQVKPDGSLGRFAPPASPSPAFGGVDISAAEKYRSYTPFRYGHPSLALQALQSAHVPPKLPADAPFLLHYYGPHETKSGRKTFQAVRASNVIFVSYGDEGDWHIDKDMFRNKIVLIGGYATGTYDEKITPLSQRIPGVDIQATAIENLLRGDQVRPLSAGVMSVITFFFSWLAAVGVVFPHRVWLKLLWSAIAVVLLLGLAVALFVRHDIIWLPLASPLVAAVVTTIGAFAWSYLGEDRQRRRLLKALSNVVPPAVAEELARDPSKLSVGAQRREMTVMFTDIAGFTDLSETLPPEKLAPMLNFYLEEMSGIVLGQSGTLDKYIGDAIMSFWNAPLPQADHAANACRAALRIVAREAAIQPALKDLGAAKILTRIGINSGPMAVGFTGSSYLINYTVLGDSVNLGSRLEGANKLYGTRAMISESTAALVNDRFVLRQLDVLRVKGKLKPMAVFELIAEGAADETTARRVKLYEEALRLYRKQRWDEADRILLEMAGEFADDGPAKALRTRIGYYRQHPPGVDWDGVYVAKEK